MWWVGLLLVIGYHPIVYSALHFTPETTAVPLGSCKVALNLLLAYGVLNERFTKADLWATMFCILGTVVTFSSLPHAVPGYMGDFPTRKLAEFCGNLYSNEGFALYLLVCFILFFAAIYATINVSLTGDLRPMALPLIVGVFNSQFHFAVKVVSTLPLHPNVKPEAWQLSPFSVLLVTAVLGVFAIASTCEGVRQLDCRFFVPAAFASTMVMVACEDLLFFREWRYMTNANLVCFVIGCFATVIGAVKISPVCNWKVGPKSGGSPTSGSTTEPLLEADDPLQKYQGVLRIMEEHKIVRPVRAGARPLSVIQLDTPQKGFWAVLRAVWKWVPISCCLGVLLACALLYAGNLQFIAFSILTVWGVHNGWKYGLHMALFSYVGQRKMAQYENCDFWELHKIQMKQRAEAGEPEPEGLRWEDVTHFVILPNYKEELEVLKLAVGSVAKSQIAANQIVVCLAMEAREVGSDDKANELMKEFKDQFRFITATFHPPNLPGETPGKPSNTNWAAKQMFETEMGKLGLNINNVVVTVADADSEFHPQYFEALTYQFLNAGCGESDTADRYVSIWQPPIIHYKNYHSQPAIVRLASLFTSQHELANLADPNAMRVPYSTYSISAALAKAVGGWDPDWISEDWHMGIKCFMATAGRIRIQPIFLGVMNYAPEGDSTWETIKARWAQAKRHALGFCEIVFFQDHFPRVLLSIDGGWKKRAVFCWRAFFLWSRCLLIHLTMATMLVIGPLTALIVAYFLRNKVLEDVNSWTFLTYLVFQSCGMISVVLFMFTNVLLYELVRPRIDEIDSKLINGLTKFRLVHFLFVATMSMILMGPFFFGGGLAEWIAALKVARTHKFTHDVAMKPNLSANGLAAGAAGTAPVAGNTSGKQNLQTVTVMGA